MKYRGLLLAIFFIGICLFSYNTVCAQDSTGQKQKASWGISTEWWSYSSFSQQKPTTPVQASYPAIESRSFALGILRSINRPNAHHDFTLTVSLPSSLDSDNGTGMNHLLKQNSHTYFRSNIDYRMSFPLFHWGNLRARHGLISGLLYENRKLHYLSGATEKAEDINLYIGPGIQLAYGLSSDWIIEGTFDGRFYLPYTNYGTLHAFNASGISVFSSAYSGFYYQTLFKLGVSWQLPKKDKLQVGVVKNDLIGFASQKPSFYVTNVVHFKLDRLFHYYVRYRF